MSEIRLADLEVSMKKWSQELIAELQATKPASVAQDTKPVDSKVDDKPVAADLLKPETKASMGAIGIAGIVESGDHFKLLKFELGPITSALVGIPVGGIASKAISAWVLPYKDATGKPTVVRPASIGFGQINLLNPVAHVGGMLLAETYGEKLIGRTAAHFIAGTLLVSVLLNYTPLASWLDNLVAKVSPKPTVAQDGGVSLNAAQAASLRQRHLQEQQQVRNNNRSSLSPF